MKSQAGRVRQLAQGPMYALEPTFQHPDRPELAGMRLTLVPIAVFQRAESSVVGEGLLTTPKGTARAPKSLF